MKVVKLDHRLQQIVSHIYGDSFADIGCDHGKLVAAAVHRGIVKSAIASDISVASLDKTRRVAIDLGYADLISCRVGDGLKVLKSGEVDTVVIAGLGGDEITKILQDMKAEKKVFSRFVLSPNTHAEKVRVEAIAQDLVFVRDYMIYSEKKFYTVIVLDGITTEKQPPLSDKQIEFGKEYAQSSVFRAWAEKEIKRIAKLIKNSENSALLERRLDRIEEAYEESKRQ